MSGEPGLFWRRRRDAARQRSCAGPGYPSPACGARKNGLCAGGVAGLLRDKTCKPGLPPLQRGVIDYVVSLTLAEPAGEATHSTKSQIQALDRTQPGLPIKKGRAGTMTHDYIRHGTTTLFAALNVHDGTIIGQCMARQRHQEFIRFLNRIEAVMLAGKLIHVILDNYAAHKHPKVRAWLSRHPRWIFHFTTTSCSWVDAVEGFFATLRPRRLQRGIFHSLVDLQAAINRYLGEHNCTSRPFVWTADPDRIIERVNRRYQAMSLNQ
jgi:transposase